MCPVINCFPWFFLLSPHHRTPVNSTRWELVQLYLMMAAILLYYFLVALLSSFIHFLLCLDRKITYSYLFSPVLPLVFCYSFPITHSDYSTPLLEAHQSHPNALRIKSKLLIRAHRALQDLASAFLSDFVLYHSHPVHSTWATWASIAVPRTSQAIYATGLCHYCSVFP